MAKSKKTPHIKRSSGRAKAGSGIKPTAIPRAGYDYQDLVGIDLLIRFFREPELFDWITLESSDPETRSLDDIVAFRHDGTVEVTQVKFTVDAQRYPLDWSWLLSKSKGGTSLLAKWSEAYFRAAGLGPVSSASLKTNREPSLEFQACLDCRYVQFDRLDSSVRAEVVSECGGKRRAERFLRAFEFVGGLPDLDRLEIKLRDAVIPTDTDLDGWNLLRAQVRRWATFKGEPSPDGRIRYEHLVQLLTRKRPKPLRQDFHVPEGYSPPTAAFHHGMVERVAEQHAPLTVVWGSPGRGKSTYLSYLATSLGSRGLVIRHHYFLSLQESTADRSSFFDIANSLTHQMRASAPEQSRGITGSSANLREDIAHVARELAKDGKWLFVFVDGIDHVWRDTNRLDQVHHLFNMLLPPRDNVSVVVGTQRVSDAHLPSRLLSRAKSTDWFEIPAMDAVAIHSWVAQQDQTRPFLLKQRQNLDRADEIKQMARALWEVSGGHPLHLIYAMESLRLRARAIDADSVRSIPACPDGDIREYYKSLWVTLPTDAKRILHALAGSNFAWPTVGIMRVFGDYTSVAFMLEARQSGLYPFHGSVFAWVRERDDHTEVFRALLPNIVAWLKSDAPTAWRWAWLWLTEARAGNVEPLLAGATRDWAVTSLAQGWPEDHIEEVLRQAEQIRFERSELDRTIALRSTKTRVSNVRSYQASNYALFRAASISISDNHEQARFWVDRLSTLDDGDLPWLARLAPRTDRKSIVSACVEELERRITVWVTLRHRPGRDFTALSDAFVSCALLQGEEALPRIMKFLRGFRDPRPRVSSYIEGLGQLADFDSLMRLRRALKGTRWYEQRREIEGQLLRAALRVGRDPSTVISPSRESLTPAAGAWFKLSKPQEQVVVIEPPLNDDALRDHRLAGSALSVEQLLVDVFWLSVCRGDGKGCDAYPHLDRSKLGWLAGALSTLERAANSLASGVESYRFGMIYDHTTELTPVQFTNARERDHAFYVAFKRSLLRIATDIHLMGRRGPHENRISYEDLEAARGSQHWSDVTWISDRVRDGMVLLQKDAASNILEHQIQKLEHKCTEFMERANEWCELARFAQLHEVGDPSSLIRRSADCLLGYGYRKDLSAMDVLDSIAHVHRSDPTGTLDRLNSVVPVIDVITEFTDGDETDHVRSELIHSVASTLSGLLPLFHQHHIDREEWRYADECLRDFIQRCNLSGPFAEALASTLLDAASLAVLKERSQASKAALDMYRRQGDFLGGLSGSPAVGKSTEESLTDEYRVNVGRYSPRRLAALLTACSGSDVSIKERVSCVKRWLEHWAAKNRAVDALATFDEYLNAHENGTGLDEAMDTAFEVSLSYMGRDAAFSWLVRAHIHRHGWSSYWTSEQETMARLQRAAEMYPERWLEFVKETARQPPYWERRARGFVIGQRYLVRFLLMVGENERAAAVTDAMVTSLVDEVRDQPIGRASWMS